MSSSTIKLGAREDGTFAFDESRLGELQHRVEILNRRGKKLGMPALTLDVVARELLPRSKDRVTPVIVVRVVGNIPVVSDHVFLARIEHHGEIGNIVTRAPGHETAVLPADLRTAEAICEHCNTRRYRKDTFVLRRPDGSLVRIGRNCLADYLRTGNPEIALRMWSLLSSVSGLLAGDEDGEGGFGGGQGYLAVTSFLATVVAVIRRVGWMSRAQARVTENATPTSELAMFACGLRPQHPHAAEIWDSYQPDPAAFEEAAEVVEWAGELGEREDLNEYLSNLRVSCSLGYVTGRNAGLVASAVMARRRENERKVERALQASRPTRHIGQIGKRMEFQLTVVRVNYTENQWGTKSIVGMVDAEGNEFTWFASGSKAYTAGDVLTGKGTVKEHNEYKGRPQTILARCAFTVAAK